MLVGETGVFVCSTPFFTFTPKEGRERREDVGREEKNGMEGEKGREKIQK